MKTCALKSRPVRGVRVTGRVSRDSRQDVSGQPPLHSHERWVGYTDRAMSPQAFSDSKGAVRLAHLACYERSEEGVRYLRLDREVIQSKEGWKSALLNDRGLSEGVAGHVRRSTEVFRREAE